MADRADHRLPLPPRSVIGILGSGQLGRMLAQAATSLGFRVHVYADESGPAFDVSAHHEIGPYDDLSRLDVFARGVDVVTYEFENVPLVAAQHLSARVTVRPGGRALGVAQDRLEEKGFISGLGIGVAPFAPVRTPADLAAAAGIMANWQGPAILKTARLGYDGKGQIPVKSPGDLADAHRALHGADCVLEKRVTFAFEISMLVVRGADGALGFYDPPRNTHADGILRNSVVPCGLTPAVIERARAMAGQIAAALDYVGLLAIEMFYLGPDAAEPLIVNEIAPRVHNSGHWTIEACVNSQFVNHIRAVAGWPLGTTVRHSDAEMNNLIGHDVDGWQQLAADEGLSLHLYGKREVRKGRKMGHTTRLGPLSS